VAGLLAERKRIQSKEKLTADTVDEIRQTCRGWWSVLPAPSAANRGCRRAASQRCCNADASPARRKGPRNDF